MFYVLIFSVMAVVLVVGAISTMHRRNKAMDLEEEHYARTTAERQQRKAKRTQSKHDRRQRS